MILCNGCLLRFLLTYAYILDMELGIDARKRTLIAILDSQNLVKPSFFFHLWLSPKL
uniref:Uncharacterized protein n=1 Tax=Rhizophora mucronata TaxID=61149 RepID=A0A2P2NZY4_RHIMU